MIEENLLFTTDVTIEGLTLKKYGFHDVSDARNI